MFETYRSEPAALATESARRALTLPAAALGALFVYQAVVPLLAATFGAVPRFLFEAIRLGLAVGGIGGAWALLLHHRHRPLDLKVHAPEIIWLIATAGATALALRTLLGMSLPSF